MASASVSVGHCVGPNISVIIPVHNGEPWIDECLQSIIDQVIPAGTQLEISAYDDASCDGTWPRLCEWQRVLEGRGIRTILGRSEFGTAGGCGFAKNCAVSQSSGEWLCFQDIDDIMLPGRIATQFAEALAYPGHLIGSRVRRAPDNSTERYTKWANGLSQDELILHRFKECTLLMPTWFMSRTDFNLAGAFQERDCEDLLMLHSHVSRGGGLRRAGQDPLVEYRFHENAASHRISRKILLKLRVSLFEQQILGSQYGWVEFSIWGVGRDGRAFFQALSEAGRSRVKAFCDVNPRKIGGEYVFRKFRIPIIHYKDVKAPFVTCVALDRTNGEFEANLASLGLFQGKHYYLFG